MSGQQAAWKKVKPFSVSTDSLTTALKDLDAVYVRFAADQSRENIALYLKALQNALNQVAAMKRKYEPKKYKTVNDWLVAREKLYKERAGQIEKLQKDFTTLVQGTLRSRESLAKALTACSSRLDKEATRKAAAEAKGFQDWFEKTLIMLPGPRGYLMSDELTKLATATINARELTKDLLKLVEAMPDAVIEESWGGSGSDETKETKDLQEALKPLSTTITDLVTHLDPGKKPPMSGLNYGEFKRFADSLQKISTRVDRNAFADAVKLGPKFADWLSKNENAIPNGTRLLKHETAELIKALNGAKPILAKLNNLDAFAGYRSASSTPRLQSTKQTVKLQQELRVVATQLRRPMKFVGIKYPPKVIQDFDVK